MLQQRKQKSGKMMVEKFIMWLIIHQTNFYFCEAEHHAVWENVNEDLLRYYA
jgi:hypothetical protein